MTIKQSVTLRPLQCFFTTFLLLATAACGEEQNVEVAKAGEPKAESAVVDSPEIEASEVREYLELRRLFAFKKDEIYPDQGWYTHTQQQASNSWNRNFLRVFVNEKGDTYLTSEYHGSDWIFHTQVKVRVGSEVFTSEEVPLYSPNHYANNSGGSVWEKNHYLGRSDNGIIRAIVQSGLRDTIVVRFEGDQHIKTFNLQQRDAKAIKESVRLGELLKTNRHLSGMRDSIGKAMQAEQQQKARVETNSGRGPVWVDVRGTFANYYCPWEPSFGKTGSGYRTTEAEAREFGIKHHAGKDCKGSN